MKVCVDCGSVWPDELSREWGEFQETSGYGPRPRCVALVPIRGRKDDARQVCGGEVAHRSMQELEERALLEAPAEGEVMFADGKVGAMVAPAGVVVRTLTKL